MNTAYMGRDSMHHPPFISVIVPVYNDEKNIRRCIEALLNQSYPSEKYEVIIVDNGSTDRTCEIIREYPVIFLKEDTIRSSYAARNKGIQCSKGEILAFTDSDCIPLADWLRNGCKGMRSNSVILGVGEIRFYSHNSQMNMYELYDSLTFLKQHKFAQKNFGATANIFIRKDVIKRIGKFRTDLISGGDYELGQRFSKVGSVEFFNDAIVKHPTRATYKEIVTKINRINIGFGQLMSLGFLPLPDNIHSLSFWRPDIRIWRRCSFWNKLKLRDKIKYWFINNMFIYLARISLMKSYKKYS